MSLLGRGHLGEDLAALVDGELDHAARDRALAHLTHCRACRDEADAHRRLKARLVELRTQDSGPAPDLLARLAGLPGAPAARLGAAPLGAPAPWSPPPAPDPAPRRSAGYAAAGALVAAGVIALLVVPTTPAPTAPAVDPASPVLVNRYAELTGGVPFTEPGAAVVTPVGAAGPGR